MREIVLALRKLRRAPVVTAGVLLTLSLAIGANFSAFSIVNSLLLRPLPVRDPDRIVTVSSDQAIRLGFSAGAGWSYGMWDRLRSRASFVESAAAWFMRDLNEASGGEKSLLTGLFASGDIFKTLGLDTVAGRAFTPADDVRGGGADGPVVVISDRLFDRRFQRSTSAIGAIIPIEGVQFRVIGILPATFRGVEVGRPIDVILPLETEPLVGRDSSVVASERSLLLIAMLRLRPGQSLASATAAIREMQPAILGDGRLPQFVREPFTLVRATTGTPGTLRGRYGPAATTMLALVAFVWLATCANVANLQLARMSARAAELRTRTALGASRWQLIGALTLEGLMLAIVAGGLGMLLSSWATRAAVGEILSTRVDVLDVSVDGVTIAFAAIVVVFTTLLFGVLPALHVTSRRSLVLAGADRLLPGTSRRAGLASLVVVQLAISFVLVVGASQFVRSALAAAAAPVGYDARRLLVATIEDPRSRDAAAIGVLQRQVLEAGAGIGGVERAALSTSVPGVAGLTMSLGPKGEERRVRVTAVTPGWFATYGTAMRAGRDFTVADVAGAPGVAIVNKALSDVLWPVEGALGQTVAGRTTVGVVENQLSWGGFTPDGIARSLNDPPVPVLYVPMAQAAGLSGPAPSRIHLSLRSADGSTLGVHAALRSSLAGVDPGLAYTVRHLGEDVRAGLAHQRVIADLSAALGALALIIAGIGLYSLVVQEVNHRRRELGIRLALGAAPDGLVARLVLRAIRLVAVGAAGGLAASLALAPLVSSLIYGAEPGDPSTLAAAAAGVAVIGVVASWIPSARTCRISPAVLLRRTD